METKMSFRPALILATVLAAWSAASSAETIKIGVTPGPHAQILEAVKPIAAKQGLVIQLIEFSDYVVPNAALDAGEIQANSFQNQPYLDNQKADRGYKIESVALTVNFPIGVYSKKHKAFADIPEGGKVSIPNDPTNGGRVLLLLRDKGVIKLKDGVGFKPTVLDITENPKKLKFIEVDAAQAPRALDDVDAAAINTNYATQAGLDPVKDPILREDPKGPYVNLIAVRSADKDKPWVKTLVDSYHTPEIKEFVLTKFKGAVLPSW
ncbi:MetQ/NlpA family ABC transporter substrate-binding protein [Bradyrhizobium sp. WYCCWR 13023]|uniref:MetQ/NlpA family ABC transporter substrate-binding protein n=1 Tax=Bradyrhizobium zhengyangense TaxID=2911009 RepID=A0A9X1RC61_9BRAD|nr:MULTISPECIES: MetQ/NlpA family ABC transporter substrate-binding protein [Bradyrhizobium]MCG2629231.1 MetQ/NlpA family ABC transporter substrate-binding protein [Bradyrhizobium zhengyangense]MCG2640786.1 MetQ/NlpA family ABC transporter substrate-binding protein [Bradyrhizobium zhengyangense]MDA9518949.1 methionine ABC transporter substrate-binding protein [Bradyrhizobium sp. CCBAU 11434]